MVRKSTRQGFDAKSIQLKSLTAAKYQCIYIQILTTVCSALFFAFSHKTRCLFSSFSVPKASSHFPRHCACTALVLCPARQHCLLSGNNCESPFCSYQRSPSLSREEEFALPSRNCCAPCFHLDSPSKSKGHQRFPPCDGGFLACSKAKQCLPYILGTLLKMRLSARLMGLR